MSNRRVAMDPIAHSKPQSPVSEAYRTVRTNLQFASVVEDTKVILMTSALPGEGKTSTAANLAVVSAQAGKRVLLVDADMRKPQVHHRFQISNLDGLSNLIIKEREVSDCVVASEVDGLFLLPSGPIPPNPSEMLASAAFSSLLAALRDDYDLVIIDSPPVLSVADSLILTRAADGVVFVVDSKHTNRTLSQKGIASLQQVNAKILGVVLNRVDASKSGSYYYYQYRYYNTGQAKA